MADLRIPALLQIPAEVRFVSLEPLLSQINLTALTHTDSDDIAKLKREYEERTGMTIYAYKNWGHGCDYWLETWLLLTKRRFIGRFHRIPRGGIVQVIHHYSKRRVLVEYQGELILTFATLLRKCNS